MTAGVKTELDALGDLVRDRVEDIDRDRRLPDEVVLGLRDTGINRLMLPTALGGTQAPVVEMLDVIERVAAVDGSTGWCAAIGAGTNLFAGYMTEVSAREVFADPNQGNASVFAPLGTVVRNSHEYMLSGRSPFTSNCLHAAWIGLGAFVHRDDGSIDPVPRLVFVRATDLTIEDTWDVLGLRGTGSHHTATEGRPVSLDRSCAFSNAPWPEGTLWRLPPFTALVPPLAAVLLGIARGAIDEITRHARERWMAIRGPLADDPVSMAELAVADTRLRGARAAVWEALDEAHLIADRGYPVDRRLQARVLLACMLAADIAVEVTSLAHRLGGGAAAYAPSPLLRALRDLETARQHIVFSHQHRADLGKALAGLDIDHKYLA